MAKIIRICEYCQENIKFIRNERVDPRFCSTPCKRLFMRRINQQITAKESELKRLYKLKEKYLWSLKNENSN